MELDREAVMQIVISGVALVVFVAAAVFVSTNYASNGGLTDQGGVAIVGAIGLFIVVMLAAGVWMERQQF
ncbi:hypothetical protein KTS45_15135 [Halomicroarcula limicola]|uniref:Uncharacterized protein n=1 Tax=Haloarcula limicola TaxID=1429915 RepID=A0A8J7YC47_9EURY|nr:hypothetical protein [Halomicroarcula limicola]MBV0925539.1 hypothetical protein [Halomicroarcula limicola]